MLKIIFIIIIIINIPKQEVWNINIPPILFIVFSNDKWQISCDIVDVCYGVLCNLGY